MIIEVNMRVKEFLIFIIIFTIVYILFFIIYDKLSLKKSKSKVKKQAKEKISIDNYQTFANFYGITTVMASIETMLHIYDDLLIDKNITISEEAKKYNLNNIEYVVIVIYLEYLGLIIKKNISLDFDIIKRLTILEQNMIQKYWPYFVNKASLEEITRNLGQNAINDIVIMNNNFLIPGVRLIDSKLYYVGDNL